MTLQNSEDGTSRVTVRVSFFVGTKGIPSGTNGVGTAIESRVVSEMSYSRCCHAATRKVAHGYELWRYE